MWRAIESRKADVFITRRRYFSPCLYITITGERQYSRSVALGSVEDPQVVHQPRPLEFSPRRFCEKGIRVVRFGLVILPLLSAKDSSPYSHRYHGTRRWKRPSLGIYSLQEGSEAFYSARARNKYENIAQADENTIHTRGSFLSLRQGINSFGQRSVSFIVERIRWKELLEQKLWTFTQIMY